MLLTRKRLFNMAQKLFQIEVRQAIWFFDLLLDSNYIALNFALEGGNIDKNSKNIIFFELSLCKLKEAVRSFRALP